MAWLKSAPFVILILEIKKIVGNMSLQKNLGIILKRLRAEKNISQEALALETGIGRRYLSDIENGRRNVSLEKIEKLASFFEISTSEFIRKMEQVKFLEPPKK